MHILLIDEIEESRSRTDKIELGDKLVKILLDSFVEMCQEVPLAKTAHAQFLPPVVSSKALPKCSEWKRSKSNIEHCTCLK